MKWLKNAFAIESEAPLTLDPAQRALVDRLCAEVVRRRLEAPALLLLEVHRPLHYVSAQVLHFFEPMVSVLFETHRYRDFARFLEQRGSIDCLVDRIETLQAGRRRSKEPPRSAAGDGRDRRSDAED